jgi:hypothetical protein
LNEASSRSHQILRLVGAPLILYAVHYFLKILLLTDLC